MFYAIPALQQQKQNITLTMIVDNDVNYDNKIDINALVDDIVSVDKLCNKFGVADEVISEILVRECEI